jgi:hypothetical protein
VVVCDGGRVVVSVTLVAVAAVAVLVLGGGVAAVVWWCWRQPTSGDRGAWSVGAYYAKNDLYWRVKGVFVGGWSTHQRPCASTNRLSDGGCPPAST